MKKVCTTFFILLTYITLSAGQPSQAVLDYIDQYKAIAVAEMVEYKIPASITMAQGILESGAGQSELAKKSNNHFGIKCHTDWKGEKVYYDDDAKDECFRKYDHVEDSYRDHSEFLSSKTRYAELFELDADDYKGWAKGLKAAGYATNPKYADLLINLIEEYDLHALDKMSLAEAKKHNKKTEEKEVKEKEDPVVKNTETKKEKNFTWGGYNEDVFYFNRIPTVTIQAGDSPEKLAEKHHKKLSLLKDYNDIENGGTLTPGTKFYLQPKRKKGDTKFHTVKEGETMWTISRDEGVRMEQLYKYNKMQSGEEPAVGEQINLRDKRKDDVKLKKEKGERREEKPSSAKASEDEEKKEERSKEKVPIEKEHVDENNDGFMDLDEEIVAPEINNTPPGAQGEQVIKKEELYTPSVNDLKVAITHTVAAKETLYGLSKIYGVTVTQIQEWNGLKDNTISIGQKLIVGYK
ncbi:MAG: LysM peptidoglycan-binding domain-containing protein [Bacteroidetes bacterium]|nr:LysM peptidoglycan-binding domain-containing protein [Bacteroidota bacterium]